jgi:hypothetical protein
MVEGEEGDNHVPAILGTALLPSLLVVVLVSHCDFSLQNMFRMVRLMVCCHEGRGSKMAEVRAFGKSCRSAISSITFMTLDHAAFVRNGQY